LHRAIQKYLEDPLAEEILKMNIKEGDAVIADLDKENQLIKFSFKEKSKKSAKSSES
jgi:ATP-dependent Clp protease ATP-binding subunit ClpC